MSTESEPELRGRFAQTTLPWLVAAGSLFLYLLTLNHWVSLGSLSHVAKLSGWTWQTELSAPLYLLVTYPFRWLPGHLIPAALNVFSAVCAALVLALLARCVSLLPHDRTAAQRERERGEFGLLSIPTAWLPPLLAVLVCGLQISFWENATSSVTSPPWSASGAMFDLLLFAYVVRCVLEYRIDERDSWLTRAAFVMGLGMTNDWAMIGYFPLFVASLIWIRGMSFFNAQFLARMFAWGTSGLLLYFLLPVVYSAFESTSVPFWLALKTNLGTQRYILQELWGQKQILAVLSFTSLLPILLMGIRWSSYFGDTSRTGTVLARFIFHIVHGFLLVACIWIALDPQVSPRNQQVGQYRGSSVQFLTFYFLGALAVGYFVGYFLLVFGPRRASRHSRYMSTPARVSARAVVAATWMLIVITPLLLLSVNLPRIRVANGPLLKQFASLLAQSLPPSSSVVLSDDVRQLVLARLTLIGNPAATNYIFADTLSLKVPEAHGHFHRAYPDRWPAELSADRTKPVEDLDLVGLVGGLAKKENIYYLHPSFGYYFEALYPEPHGIVQKLNLYPSRSVLPPKLSPDLVSSNLQFWATARELTLAPLASILESGNPKRNPTFLSSFLQSLHLKLAPHPDAVALGQIYSRSLNNWGAQLQCEEKFAEAAECFALAQQLNRENVVADINAAYNRLHRLGTNAPLPISKHIDEEFGKYRTWEEVLVRNGPYDEPGFCYSQGMQFLQGKNYRQAGQQFQRAISLYPGHVAAGLELAGMYITGNEPDLALEVIRNLKRSSDPAIQKTNQLGLLIAEASAHLAMKEPEKASELFRDSLARNPDDLQELDAAETLFLRYKFFSESIPWIDRRLKLTPDDPNSLVNKGYALLQMSEYEKAIPPLTRAISTVTNNVDLRDSALFNRAIVLVKTGRLDEAAADYQELLTRYENATQIHYGLAEIAIQKKDTNAAIASFERYLKLAPAESDEAKAVQERLKQLKAGSP